jgi:DNA-binding transcriptional regulator YiaG
MKKPALICPDGPSARLLRQNLKMNQLEFWSKVGVTQSCGSRYESGREMPGQVAWMLHLVYGTEGQALKLLTWFRSKT